MRRGDARATRRRDEMHRHVESVRDEIRASHDSYEQLFDSLHSYRRKLLDALDARAVCLVLDGRRIWLSDDDSSHLAEPLARMVASRLEERDFVTVRSIVDELDESAARSITRLISEMVMEVQSRRLHQLNVRTERLLERVEQMAKTDELTGLPNRKELLQQINREHERADRYGHPLALMLLDLDHFKQINDRYGHRAGDAVLEQTGPFLEKATRESDTAGRYGGEEFAVVLPQTDAAAAEQVAERVLERFRSHVFEHDGHEFSVTCSIGVTERLDGDETADDLIERADKALYRAKENGRDRYVSDGASSGRS